MIDIFISYASEDRPRVKPLAEVLEKMGWSVWWDQTIPIGRTWHDVIEAALKESRCVMVLWSQSSVKSDWVKTEADEGKRRGILIPALLDDVNIPLGFRSIQAANLVGWPSPAKNAEFDELVKAISRVLSTAGPPAPAPPPPQPNPAPDRELLRTFVRIGAPVLAGVAGTLLYFTLGHRDRKDGPPPPVTVSLEPRRNPQDGLIYVWIPPARFTMGCSPNDDTCTAQEKPPHDVRISKGFWMGQTEVTVGAYKKFVQASSDRTLPPTTDYFQHSVQEPWTNDRLPMTNVQWEEAQGFCGWIGGRLPTEAEWEYAARGRVAAPRYGPLDDIAWYAANSAVRVPGLYIRELHEPARKAANKFELYDMLGNAIEWVADWYDQGYYNYSPATDPPGPADTGLRVFRGSCSDNNSKELRVSIRGGLDPKRRIYIFGFRCVWDNKTNSRL